MKKIMSCFVFCSILALVLAFPANARQQSPSPSCSTCASQGAGSQTQTENQTQNQGEETQLQIQERTEAEIQKSQPLYSAKEATSRTRTEAVGEAVENMVRLSFQLQNEELGQQVRTVTRAQIQSIDKTNEAIDEAENRNSFVEFLIGINYNQLKIAKQEIEQNRLRIQELNRIRAQISNEGDEAELQNQIKVLEEQNTSLENQINDILSGFSLLGWLFKWISGYNN